VDEPLLDLPTKMDKNDDRAVAIFGMKGQVQFSYDGTYPGARIPRSGATTGCAACWGPGGGTDGRARSSSDALLELQGSGTAR